MDGINKGQTPLQLNRVEAKAHKIKIIKSLYHDLSETILLKPGDGFAKTYQLRSAFGTLKVSCNKKGARVLVNGGEGGTAREQCRRFHRGGFSSRY